MKFTIERDAFIDVLFRIQGVCAQKSTLPILSSCLVEATEDGQVFVHGTDLEVSVSTQCVAEVEGAGRAVLAAKRLFDTVKSIPTGSIAIESEPNHWATLNAGMVKARITGTHAEEYPKLPEVSDELPMQVPSDALLDMIEKTFFSISTDEARAAFTGALLSLADQGGLQMVSTDGHRLSKISIQLEDFDPGNAKEAFTKGVIVPRKGLNELRRVLKPGLIVGLGISGDNLLVSVENTRLAIRLIPGRFPNFAKVIPDELDHHVEASRDAVIQALKRAGYYTAKMGNTRITLSPSTLEIFAFDPEAGELREPIPCVYDGKGVSAGFNYRYLLDVLNVIESDTFTMDLIDTESPTVIRDVSRNDVLFIVMPMQL